MSCDDISPAEFWFCYLRALPLVFIVWSSPGFSQWCKAGYLNGVKWREWNSFGRHHQCSWVLSRHRTLHILAVASCYLGNRGEHQSDADSRALKIPKWPNYSRGTHCLLRCMAGNDKFVDPEHKSLPSWQQPLSGDVIAQTCLGR